MGQSRKLKEFSDKLEVGDLFKYGFNHVQYIVEVKRILPFSDKLLVILAADSVYGVFHSQKMNFDDLRGTANLLIEALIAKKIEAGNRLVLGSFYWTYDPELEDLRFIEASQIPGNLPGTPATNVDIFIEIIADIGIDIFRIACGIERKEEPSDE